jgi:hypothetical protein
MTPPVIGFRASLQQAEAGRGACSYREMEIYFAALSLLIPSYAGLTRVSIALRKELLASRWMAGSSGAKTRFALLPGHDGVMRGSG